MLIKSGVFWLHAIFYFSLKNLVGNCSMGRSYSISVNSKLHLHVFEFILHCLRELNSFRRIGKVIFDYSSYTRVVVNFIFWVKILPKICFIPILFIIIFSFFLNGINNHYDGVTGKWWHSNWYRIQVMKRYCLNLLRFLMLKNLYLTIFLSNFYPLSKI